MAIKQIYLSVFAALCVVVLNASSCLATPQQYLFWSDYNHGTISRSDLSGANSVTIISGLANPSGIALDTSLNKIYWLDSGSRKISRANLDGGNVETVLTSGITQDSSLSLDQTTSLLYWYGDTNTKIYRASSTSLNQTSVTTVVNSLNNVRGILASSTTGYLYFSEFTQQVVKRVALSSLGGGPTDGSGLGTYFSTVGMTTMSGPTL